MKRIIILLILITILLTGCSKGTPTQQKWQMLQENAQKVDQILQTELDRLEGLARKVEVQDGDSETILGLMNAGAEKRCEALYWYSLPDGSYYTSQVGKTDSNLSDREYFPTLLAGKPVVGSPIVGKTSGKKSFVIAVPLKKAEQVIGILGTSIYLPDFWKNLQAQMQLPAKYDFYAVNSWGTTIFDLESMDLLLDKPLQQDSPSLVEAIKKIITSDKGSLEYNWNNKTKTAIYQKSEVSDWRYVLSFY